MKLQDVFPASLCRNGIIGGLLYVKERELIYCTNKLTVSEAIRRLHMPFDSIQSIEKESFYTIVINLKDGHNYRFLVFLRKRFMNRVTELAGI